MAKKMRTDGFNLVFTQKTRDFYGKRKEREVGGERQVEAGGTSTRRLRSREPAARDQPQSQRLGRVPREYGRVRRNRSDRVWSKDHLTDVTDKPAGSVPGRRADN